MYKLAVLNTHPIQYFAPLYRRIALEPDIDLTVYYCSRQGSEEYLDEGFGERVKWDIPLLDGYQYKFLNNLWGRDHVGGFGSLINPGIVSELRKYRYDALLVNGHNHITYLLAMLAAKAFGTSVMMRCETHLKLHRSPLKRTLRKPVMSFFYKRLCDLCLPIGTSNKEFYLFHGVEEGRMFTVPYAVDNEYFTSAAKQYSKTDRRKEFGLPQDKPIILFASKLLSRKRPMDLLLAFQRLQQQGVNAALLFVGSGEREFELKNHVREHELSDVHFLGFKNQSELPKYYSVADVFVFPSENEPWGLVLNEVMCAGLPIIASREIGAVPDLVHHGENGFTYEAGDIDELERCLKQLLEAPEKRELMAKASRAIIGQWNYEYCV
ncbi:MAG TPA: glycosyltransferase family 4 protein, partial [Pyrinomonadaceae bacterium]|nr:glycosyltransferase family 4 protein [Pyrinomonadaceae bacterium]